MSDGIGNAVTDPGPAPLELGHGAEDREGSATEEVLQEASDTLLLGPIWREVDDEACTERFASVPEDNVNVLLVTLTQPAEDRVAVLQNHMETLPARIRVVSASDDVASETSISVERNEISVVVDVVGDPGDLPRLGITIQEAAAGFNDDRPTLVCFHSLTALLQYATTQRVFRFLHIMQNAIDARSHFHMDANSHDIQTVQTIKQLFDTVIEFDEHGNEVVTR